MLKPKMIMFDYGNTLVYENVQDNSNAFKGIFKYVTKNDNNIDIEKLYGDFRKFKRETFDKFHNVGFEAKYVDLFRFFMGVRNIEFSIPWEKLEEIYFDDYASAIKMPMVDDFLDMLEEDGIRLGIISNISISGENLEKRVSKIFGERFEFVIATNDYVYRKPSREIFNVAMAKANLKPEEVWYVGDNPVADVIGATESRIFPILFDAPFENHFRWDHEYYMPDCDFIKVESYEELIKIYKNMEWE